MKNAPGPRVSLRQIEAFCSVALAGGVSNAAKRLSRTQSAVSMAVIELEQVLGVKLFERIGRRLHPTEAAQRLLPKAIELTERVEEMFDLVLDDPRRSGHLSIGASRTIGPFAMPQLVESFVASRPKATIALEVANTDELVGRVRALKLDCAFVEGEPGDPTLARQAWARDELCLFARAGHPLLAGALSARGREAPGGELALGARRIRAARLRSASWALRERGSGTRDIFLRAVAPSIGDLHVAVEVSDPLALKQLVLRTDLLGCLSRLAIDPELRSGTLCEIAPPTAEAARALGRVLWLVWHPGRYRTPLVDAFIAHAGSHALRA